MSAQLVELEDRGLNCIAEDAFADEDSRADGVTASEIHAIAVGSRKAWRSILDGKLNGSTFRGNGHTRRGHEREAEMLAWLLANVPDVVALGGNIALFGNWESPLHRATPDGFGMSSAAYGEFGAEVKSHDEGWESDTCPPEHVDQVQWGMHVTGLGWWLYGWEVIGVEGVRWMWIPRDDKRIDFLVSQANAFIEWREAGAPQVDDIPDEVDDAIADYRRATDDAGDARKRQAAARLVIDPWAAGLSAVGAPLRRNGSRGGLFFEPKPDAVTFDEARWMEEDSISHSEYVAHRERVAEMEKAAVERFPLYKPVAPTFRINANEKAGA